MLKKYQVFNEWIAVKITGALGTMECAYLFALLAILGGTGVNWHNAFQVVQWISTTFLQLVLLSVLQLGNNLLNKNSEERSKTDHEMIKEEFDEIKKMSQTLLLIAKRIEKDNSFLVQSVVKDTEDN